MVATLVADRWGGHRVPEQWDVALTSCFSCNRVGHSHGRRLFELLFSFCVAQQDREVLLWLLSGLAA